jgi:hypothetical protein
MGISSFSRDYFEARERFIGAAANAGAELESFTCPARGPAGEVLTTDIAWLGPPHADKVMVVISATHGVEGFCGSALQLDWLATLGAAALPRDTAMLMIHAINPYGFAWLRRVTQEGVDLNRNFLDPSRPAPLNPGYAAIADDLLPASLTGPAAEAADARLAAYRKQVGDLAYFRTVASGQYTHPDGMFYGGDGPTWSHRTTNEIIARHLVGRPDVAVVDFHTGLGPFGYGDPITNYPVDSAGSDRVRAFWGDSVTEMQRGQTLPMVKDGSTHDGYLRALPESRVTFATLEFGTYDRDVGRKALRADHWLHKHGDPLGAEAGPIRQALRRQYFPDTADWKEAVLFRGHQVVRMAINGLNGHFAESGKAKPMENLS